MLEAVTREVTRNFGKFVKRWCWDVVGVERDDLRSSFTREAVKEMSRTGTKLWTMPSVNKALISVDKD